MSAVAHEFETPAEVRPSGQNGINMAAAPPAREDGFSVSATELASKPHPNRAIQSTVSVPHTRILSRPSAGGVHFSDAGRTAASGSANGGKSHAVPYEGTVVHPSSRGRVSRSGAGAGAVASGAEAKAVVQLAGEKVKAAKVQFPQEIAAADHRATPAGGKKRVPEPRLKHAHLPKVPEAYATAAAANGNGASAVKTTSRRRRRNGNTAGAEGRRPPHSQTAGQGAVKATKAKQPVGISKKTQGENGRAHCTEPAASSQESGKRKAAAARTAEAAAAAKGSPKQKPAKKAIPAAAAAAAATTNAKSAEHGAAAQSQTEKSAAAAEASADQACVDKKNIVEEATTEVDGVLSAPAVEKEAAAAAKHADPEATGAKEEAAEQPEEDATEL
ncbi:hypothetical protein LMJF_31_1050 [Leishmania major strain Friedlin]|uniref:Uncharacterized protein n=1 Tax=Leishmania major TaxID=5664 RepID=Q4Q6F8_LEIMA|nr:hypothetical protein LMJF_31_1050 [Leishmania major strain Friedlin]CAG9579268.1 hypothetical_protein_-_conserved [Leishmania major strain Friedlin]CAJ08292.2 hypothetical protein LMJF_31_1050 [Leishmania major strain Friedlin]|eukprot:XP_001685090.2 hypothetical protein LMJF_31_1050 [Leishmania major strain Friedlin]